MHTRPNVWPHIKCPASRQDITEIQQYFLTHHHIPQVIGMIDGTLIPILTPSVDDHVYTLTRIIRNTYSISH